MPLVHALSLRWLWPVLLLLLMMMEGRRRWNVEKQRREEEQERKRGREKGSHLLCTRTAYHGLHVMLHGPTQRPQIEYQNSKEKEEDVDWLMKAHSTRRSSSTTGPAWWRFRRGFLVEDNRVPRPQDSFLLNVVLPFNQSLRDCGSTSAKKKSDWGPRGTNCSGRLLQCLRVGRDELDG